MNLNQKLILGLSFGCFILSIFVDNNDNSSYSSVQSVVTLNGGAQNRSSENIPSVTPALDVKVSKNSSSSVSSSKKDVSTPQPGNKIKYFPNENPGGSGSGNNGPETGEWETKTLCPNPDEVLSEQRRKLLAVQPTPTAKLDKQVQSEHTYSNSAITPFSFYSKEGKILTVNNKELEKIVYAHSDDIDLLNFADRVVCPIQTDPTKFQRLECRAVLILVRKKH